MSTRPKRDTPMGQEIRRLREQRGWSLGELAKRGGTTKSYVFGIENGQSVPTIGKFWKLAHALGVSMEGLFTGHGDLGQVGTGDRVGAILAERQGQNEKWGANRNLPPDKWVTILTEEVGEVARAVQEHDMLAMRAEAVQVAAVALAIMEWVDMYGHERQRDTEKGGSESVPCWE